MLDLSRDGRRRQLARSKPYQLRLNPAVRLLFVVPSAVSPIEPDDGDAVEQFLLGADLAKPFVVGGRQRLAGDETGAGIGNAQPGRLLGLVIPRRVAAMPGTGTMPCWMTL